MINLLRSFGALAVGLSILAGCESGSDASSKRPGAPAHASATSKTVSTPPRKKPAARPSKRGEDWNEGGIAWMGYDDGLAAAKAAHKPICLVFFTTWCPHCRAYSHVFSDPRVVAQAKKLVMVRLDKDKHAELSKRYAVDGEYIPRTLFLRSDGTLEKSIHAPRARYQYFYDEHKADGLLAGMAEALAKLH